MDAILSDRSVGPLFFHPVRGGLPLVKIDKTAFEEWARGVFPTSPSFSLSRVAALAGVSRSTFFWQTSRGYLEAQVIVDVSRALGLDPLGQMLSFPELEVFADPRDPSTAEVLSQIHPEAQMEELLHRSKKVSNVHPLEPLPVPYGLKRWLDCYELWGRYDEMARAMGLASNKSLTKKISENKISIGELVQMAGVGELVPRFGLVVCNVLTLEEAGYPKTLREDALTSASTGAVVDALRASLRWFEKQVEARKLADDFYENLS